MKLSTVLLAASLVANLVLATYFFSNPSAETPATLAPVAAPTRPAPTAPGPETWDRLLAEDLAGQRDRLRAEGFPPDIVRAILATRVREQFAARRKSLETSQANQPFWKNVALNPAQQAEYRALAKEEAAALKALLGSDPDNGFLSNLRRQLPGFSEERLEQIAAVRERYNEQRQALYGNSMTGITPDEREKVRALEKAQEAEIATLLTPAEFEDYQLRTSNVAQNLRHNLSAFNVTEAEFRALFRLQSEFEATSPSMLNTMTPEQSRARSDSQRKLQDEIRTALGPERYTEYQRATDYDYRQSTQLVARLGLAPETANQLYTLRQETQPRIGAIHSNRDLPLADRTAQLTALQTELQTKITAVLGATGYEAYKSYGGSWLQSLRPPTPPPPRPGG